MTDDKSQTGNHDHRPINVSKTRTLRGQTANLSATEAAVDRALAQPADIHREPQAFDDLL